MQSEADHLREEIAAYRNDLAAEQRKRLAAEFRLAPHARGIENCL